jgi:hypothetical protein
MNREQKIEDEKEALVRDRLETINRQLAETEQALRRTLEFFDRIEGSSLASRLGASHIRLRLLADLERIGRERSGPTAPVNDR